MERQRAESPGADAREDRDLPELVSELWELVRAYFRQETVEPLRNVGREVAFGVGGAVAIGIGVVFLAVGSLRLLQIETDTTFTGNLTWVPYVIVFLALLVAAALAIRAIGRRPSR